MNVLVRIKLGSVFGRVQLRYGRRISRRFCDVPKSPLDALLQSKELAVNDPEGPELLLNLPRDGKRVLVVHPVPERQSSLSKRRGDLLLAEARTLVKTLPEYSVVDAVKLGTYNLNQVKLFAVGNIERIHEMVKLLGANALMFNVSMLTGPQHAELSDEFKMTILDRYTVVLNIFRYHARTREAKLQIALAEIPYYRSRLRMLPRISGYERSMNFGGETFLERCKNTINGRESSLKEQLAQVRSHRHVLRQNRKRLELPVVAVVGYTNAGKTSLIKQLAQNEEKLVPEDRLFATLDVTVHEGRLPSLQKVLYADTVGFIQDIPTQLIASFAATLDDVSFAEIIVHVRDLSHPDTVAQKETVLQTLRQIGLKDDALNRVIEVGNKVDLVKNLESTTEQLMCDSKCIFVSALSGKGVGVILSRIDESLMRLRDTVYLCVSNGGSEYVWLYRYGTVVSVVPDEANPNMCTVEVILTAAVKAKFISQFGDCRVPGSFEIERDADEMLLDEILNKSSNCPR